MKLFRKVILQGGYHEIYEKTGTIGTVPVSHEHIGHLFQDRFKSIPVEDENYLLAHIVTLHKIQSKQGFGKN